jgi:hypothetical protein
MILGYVTLSLRPSILDSPHMDCWNTGVVTRWSMSRLKNLKYHELYNRAFLDGVNDCRQYRDMAFEASAESITTTE